MLNDWFSIHYGENFMNYKLMVNNLAVQYVKWIKKIFLPLYLDKKVKKKERTIRATGLKSLSIMSITILNNQLDGSLASDTPVFQKFSYFNQFVPFLPHIWPSVLCASQYGTISSSKFHFWFQIWNLNLIFDCRIESIPNFSLENIFHSRYYLG